MSSCYFSSQLGPFIRDSSHIPHSAPGSSLHSWWQLTVQSFLEPLFNGFTQLQSVPLGAFRRISQRGLHHSMVQSLIPWMVGMSSNCCPSWVSGSNLPGCHPTAPGQHLGNSCIFGGSILKILADCYFFSFELYLLNAKKKTETSKFKLGSSE